MSNMPPPLVLPLVSIMRRYGVLFPYSAIYCTAYRLKSIIGLQSLCIVGFINITSNINITSHKQISIS